jgi:hypothetical protein
MCPITYGHSPPPGQHEADERFQYKPLLPEPYPEPLNPLEPAVTSYRRAPPPGAAPRLAVPIFSARLDTLTVEGRSWNHKRVHRVYCALRLNLPRRTTRRVPRQIRQPLTAPPVSSTGVRSTAWRRTTSNPGNPRR